MKLKEIIRNIELLLIVAGEKELAEAEKKLRAKEVEASKSVGE